MDADLQESMKNYGRRETTIAIPRKLIGKFDIKLIYKLSCSIGKIKKIDRNDWVKLEKIGLAKKVRFNQQEIKEILSNKSKCLVTEIENTPIHICEWCESQTYILHSHHFPIAKKDGGKNTVEICANCHSEFHWLVDRYHYKPDEEYEKIFLDDYQEIYNYFDFQEVNNVTF